jgi:hypothetical protein
MLLTRPIRWPPSATADEWLHNTMVKETVSWELQVQTIQKEEKWCIIFYRMCLTWWLKVGVSKEEKVRIHNHTSFKIIRAKKPPASSNRKYIASPANRSSINNEVHALGTWRGLTRGSHQALEGLAGWIGLKIIMGLIPKESSVLFKCGGTQLGEDLE